MSTSKRPKPDSHFRRTNPSDRESGNRPHSRSVLEKILHPINGTTSIFASALPVRHDRRGKVSKIRQLLQCPPASLTHPIPKANVDLMKKTINVTINGRLYQ